jgi:acyl-CoA dehydrogenase
MTVDVRADVDRLSTGELRSQVRDLVNQWRDAQRFAPTCDSWLRSYDPAFTKELAKRGFIGMTWPRRYGGGEYSNVDRLAVTEELLRAGAPVSAHWIADRQIGPAILRHGSEYLRDSILPGITRGEYLFCLGLSEPEAGSDLAAVRTSAERVDGGWLITGRKIWTSGAHHATHCYVLARTEKTDRKHVGLSEFVVDMTTPGIDVTPIVDMAGDHHFNETVFDRVFVPESNLIGVEGHGWRQVIEQLSFERGGPERVLSTYPLLTQMLERPDRIRELGVKREIGVLIARLATLRRLCWDVARSLDNGESTVVQAATLKMLGNAFERDVIMVARDILGGPSSSPQNSYGQALLASPGFSLRGGAADVLLSIIAKQETKP